MSYSDGTYKFLLEELEGLEYRVVPEHLTDEEISFYQGDQVPTAEMKEDLGASLS